MSWTSLNSLNRKRKSSIDDKRRKEPSSSRLYFFYEEGKQLPQGGRKKEIAALKMKGYNYLDEERISTSKEGK